MKLIVCLDERRGMTFNRRRQSRDRLLIENLLGMVGEDRLWIAPYSAPLFDGKEKEISVSEDFLREAGEGEWCFVENQLCAPFLSKVEEITVYWWNRHYPSDVCFDIDLPKEGFSSQMREEFVGSSHEMITKEVFRR
ncbi:MAG: ribonuclease Z [Clostridia bacterium]|nr:ribonuclease Z [Clostridia bacterium]